jgi:EAL domain-containing protein (putative c-di-GMP-specific phosphodiesterase class I)
VNLSAVQFRHPDLPELITRILAEEKLPPECLELELTEGVLMNNVESSHATLGALKELGVKLVVDDFGTGYSSLSYLQQFPIDTLKIDQSFVRDLTPVSNNGIIVTAVIGMSRNLRLRVVAEGVETGEQYQFLRGLGCDEGQGFYFSPPIAADQFARLLETGVSVSSDKLRLASQNRPTGGMAIHHAS